MLITSQNAPQQIMPSSCEVDCISLCLFDQSKFSWFSHNVSHSHVTESPNPHFWRKYKYCIFRSFIFSSLFSFSFLFFSFLFFFLFLTSCLYWPHLFEFAHSSASLYLFWSDILSKISNSQTVRLNQKMVTACNTTT